jgi:serine protease Do
MKRQSLTILLVVLFATQLAGCVFAYRGPEPGVQPQVTVHPTGLPGQPETVWKDAPTPARRAEPLTSETYVELAERVNSAVVNIFTETAIKTRVGDPLGLFTIRTPNMDFAANALGTGFLISPDGFVITNAHVVAQADEIKVFLWQISEVKKAKIVGIDRASDVALLKISHRDPLPYLPLADSDAVRVGEIVVAVGNPFGLQHSLTDGLISAKHRRLHKDQRARYEDFLQTSAQINPGNSGGPLLNLHGEVVGVNTAVVAGGQGIGFAVPANLIKGIVPHLMRSGRVQPAYVGVVVDEITPELARRLRLAKDVGAIIDEVRADGPAEKAGLLAGDVILAVGDQPVRDAASLGRMIALLRIGEPAELTIIRSERRRTITIVPTRPPADNS